MANVAGFPVIMLSLLINNNEAAKGRVANAINIEMPVIAFEYAVF